jgi:enoyl-CoA hydratase/carnithine racemase
LPEQQTPADELLLEERGRVLHITLNRPERMNALTSSPGGVRDRIVAAMRGADANDAIGCVVLKANGPAFSAGGDLNANAGKSPSTLDHYHFYDQLSGFYGSIRGARKPTIAAVNGLCLGAALGLIVQFDIVVVSETARLGLIEGRIGHPGAAELVPHIGAAWTKFLILTGELISGKRAAEIGLALIAVPENELAQRAASLAERIAALPREGVLLNKATVNAIFDATGVAAGRVVGRAHETLTRSMTHAATAPDGRLFEHILREEGISGLKRARELQYKDPWLRDE